jgi:hypothetical protein
MPITTESSNDILKNERDILSNVGKVSKAVADQLALEQYDIFHQHRLVTEAEVETLDDALIICAGDGHMHVAVL